MPIYSYNCTCGYRLEISRSITEADTPLSCPTCKAELKRNYQFASVTFKGSGFYRTDKNA